MDSERPRIIQLPRIYDPRGSLTFVQSEDQIPFKLERAYWVYDVPGGESRGSHSHIRTQELIIAASGSFNVNLFDGRETLIFNLTRPFEGLYVPPSYWRTLENFSSGSVCLVLTSLPFSEDDYIRDFEEFCKIRNAQ